MIKQIQGRIEGEGAGGAHPPPPWDDLRFSNTTGILQKKTMWFIAVEVEQETSAPPPKKNPGSAPEIGRALRGRAILFIPCMIKDRVGLHSVLSACGGSVAERLERWTCNSEVVGILNPVMFDLNYLCQSFARRH